MKLLYFFIALVICAGMIGNAFAVERGYNYDITQNPDNSFTWSSAKPRIFDGSSWVDYIQIEPTYIATAHGNVKLNGDGSYTWYNGNTELFTDRIVAKYADISNLNSWTYPATLNNAVPSISWNGNTLTSAKQKSGIGLLEYKYVDINGKWKTQLEATNQSVLTTKVFGFEQIIDLKRDTIKFGGVTRNLDNFDGVTFDKNFLDANQGKILDFMNSVNYDFDLGYENLYSITIHDTGLNSTQLVFDYRTNTVLLPNSKLVIDPTFGYAAVSNNYSFVTSAGSGGNCITTWSADGQGGWIQASPAGQCYGQVNQWDISSLSTSIAVTDVKIRYDISSVTNSGKACKWNSIESKPSTNTGQGRVTDASDGTTFVSSDTNCQTNTNDYILDLGSSADSDLQANISDGWWAVGTMPTPYTYDATNRYELLSDVELQVTYYEICTAPTLSFIKTQNTTGIYLGWTKPSTSCNVTNYKIFESKNSATYTLKSTLGNVTSTNYNTLDTGTMYSYKISAGNSIGYGTNSTVGTNSTLPIAPTSLNAIPASKTKINLEYSDGSQPNVLWFKSRYSSGGAWTNFSTNSSVNTPRYENFTGLVGSTSYNMQIASGTKGGWGAWSSNATAYTMTTTSGTLTFDYSNLGDMFLFNGTLSNIIASPSPQTATQVIVIDNGTTTNTKTISDTLTNGASASITFIPVQITDNDLHQIKLRITATNNTGTVTIDSATQNITREYSPTYFTAVDPTQGLVNYTLSRSTDQTELYIAVNRDLNAAAFQIECQYRTMTEAAFESPGTWRNFTGVYYLNDTINDVSGTPYYIDCYNDGLLFQTISYTNSSMLLAGIQVFDDTYGTFIGVPVGVFFIVLVAGMANQRTAPMWIVVILAIAGIMSTIGFFTLDQNVWALALIAALLGIIVGRKLF